MILYRQTNFNGENMKNNILLIAFFIVLNQGVFSQAGYRNYLFGMSVDEIRHMHINDNFQRDDRVRYNFSSNILIVVSYYKNYIHNDVVISPRVSDFILDNHYVAWNTDWEMHFFFHNNRLRIIYFYNRNTVTMDDLRNRYGNPVWYERAFYNEEFFIYVNDTNRYVINYRRWNNNNYIQSDQILFVDREWADNLCNENFTRYMKEIERQRNNILD